VIEHARVIALDDTRHAGVIAVPVIVDNQGGHLAESIPASLGSHELPRHLSPEWCAANGVKDVAGSAASLRSFDGPAIILVSIGESYNDLEALRLASAAVVRRAHGASVAFLLPTEALHNVADATQAVVEGAMLASYDFKKPESDAEILIAATGVPLPTVTAHEDAVLGAHRGAVIATTTNWAKRLVDTPPNLMTPKGVAKAVEARLDGLEHVTLDVWTESTIREERLGAVMGVSQGSAEPARVIIATYTPPKASVHIALVGKGITFDTGGLNLKPLPGMMEMKTDMSGAAVVTGVLAAVAELKLPIELTVIAPCVENMPGGKAVKPSDILTSRSGRTIEVMNPDAEGRLVLADGLTLAVESEPDAVIDVATLTGAMATALGGECAGFFSSTDDLAKRVTAASHETGEGFWQMPLFAKYEKDIASDVADLKNMGNPSGRGGAIAAALFLQHFTEGLPWLHLDIAGPGRAPSASGYTTKGGTAWGLRTLVALVRDAAKESVA